MRIQTLYLDTSVIGGFHDTEWTGFNAVNLLQGFPPVSIVNPKELIYASADQDI